MKKKSLALAVIAVMMVASLATALTLAYFTDNKTAENVFTVGNVAIDLTEPSWPTGDTPTKAANPGVPIAKDPYVKNTGANDAYVRVKVTIDKADKFLELAAKYENDGNDNTSIKDLATIFAGHNTAIVNAPAGFTQSSGDWTRVGDYTQVGDKLVYVYNYNTMLKHNEMTDYLFTSVTLPSYFNNTDMGKLAGGFTITVVAEAIQADGFTNVTDAFNHWA